MELTEVGWGDRLPVIPPGRQHFETVEVFERDGQALEVRVNLEFNRTTGLLSARFQTSDPVTGLPPAVQHGFLPPEDGTARGQGHFSYLVRAHDPPPDGTRIPNVAIIQFDLGEVIATHQVDPHAPSQGVDPAKEFLNTIDASVPSSQVLALPPTISTSVFPVRWSGSDGPDRAGIASYEVFVSVDGGAWQLGLGPAPETQADFAGSVGHTYSFFSVAIDSVGYREPAPPVADAQTTVIATVVNRIEVLLVDSSPVLRWTTVAGQR